MSSPRIATAVYVITTGVMAGQDLGLLLSSYVDPRSNGSLGADEQEEVHALVIRELEFEDAKRSAEVEDPALVADPEGHFEWYDDWLLANADNRYYWDRLSSFVGHELRSRYRDSADGPTHAGKIMRSVDRATDLVLSHLEDPARHVFSTKGLVIGHVQSGKTANYTAVIAKAADAGYRVVVILTGIHNNLRKQTQQRLDRELTGEPDADDVNTVGLPALEYRQWVRVTNRDRDFGELAISYLNTCAIYRRPILAVMKKNCQVMRRFIAWASKADEEARQAMPMLLIDDEADLASIDTRYAKGDDPTSTNRLIRETLRLFPRNAYLGYTATPFANVLIDQNVLRSDLGRNLYPRNFIISLPPPDDYFGAEQIFAHGDEEIYVRYIPDDEVSELVTRRPRTAGSVPRDVTANLVRAVESFILASAARAQRGQAEEPMTMLVHTTPWQAGHRRMWELLSESCQSLQARWQDRHERPVLLGELGELWQEDFVPSTRRLENMFPGREQSFELIEPHIGPFLDELQVLELNCSSDDELDYTNHSDIKVLAVGGNQLSRGLTLEGLTTSLYLRETRAYDTLLQMGRWFGYRQGYEDLTRVYTSHRLANWFGHLALVERELRDEVSRYEDEGLTPTDLSVRIRSHSTMAVTARNKMGRGQVVQGSFSRKLAQTIWFLLDQPEVLHGNLRAGEAFIKLIQAKKGFTSVPGGHLAKSVDGALALDFLQEYVFDTRREGGGPSLDSEEMLAYIARLQAAGELKCWNVVVTGQQRPEPAENREVDFGGLPIIPVQRSRIRNTTYKIGALSDPADLIVDLPGDPPNQYDGRVDPLLLLYRVWQGSTPSRNPLKLCSLFENLDERVDVLGLALVFPESRVEPHDYIAQPDGGS